MLDPGRRVRGQVSRTSGNGVESGPREPGSSGRDTQPWASVLASELTGDLPCLRCGYNLRGLSIRESCPECDAPVRATILALVDPKAGELKAMTRPRLTAWGLVVWSGAALIAALASWVIRLSELSLHWLDVAWSPSWTAWLVVLMTLASGLGSVVLINPHGGLSLLARVRALVGVLGYVPLTLLLWYLFMDVDAGKAKPVFGSVGDDTIRTLVRLGIAGALALIILGLRPTARGLAMRSVVVRTGKVDRQSLLALLGAVGIAASGDALRLFTGDVRGPLGQALQTGEVVLIAVGSVLVTIGLVGVLIDCVRLRPVLVSSGVGIADILDDEPRRSRGAR